MSLNSFRVPGLFLQLFGDHGFISWAFLSLDDASLCQGLSGAREMESHCVRITSDSRSSDLRSLLL